MCRYFLNISSTFKQYRDNTDNRDHFGTVTSLVSSKINTVALVEFLIN